MSADTLIDVQAVSRHYGNTRAVDDISFCLRRGEVLGFLGPNGAGKTTTMQMISGNLAPSMGRVLINDIDILDEPRAAKAELGYLPETPPLYRELTVNEYLQYCARLNRIRRGHIDKAVDDARQRCGLTEVGHRLIGNLSKGYRQRVGIAQAIIHRPAVVILDEPTVGLDPIQIREIRGLIKELGKDHGVILSTHILPEVQTTCTHVQILHQGKLVFSDDLNGLEQRMQSSSLIVGMHQPPQLNELEALSGVRSVERLDDQRLRLYHHVGEDPAEALALQAANKGWRLFELSPEHVTLEQMFVQLTCTEPPA